MICKAAMQEAKAIKPIQSNENPLEIGFFGTTAMTAIRAQKPKGTSVKNIQRQLSSSLKYPPIVGAITGPKIVPIPHIAMAIDLCLIGNAAKTKA